MNPVNSREVPGTSFVIVGDPDALQLAVKWIGKIGEVETVAELTGVLKHAIGRIPPPIAGPGPSNDQWHDAASDELAHDLSRNFGRTWDEKLTESLSDPLEHRVQMEALRTKLNSRSKPLIMGALLSLFPPHPSRVDGVPMFLVHLATIETSLSPPLPNGRYLQPSLPPALYALLISQARNEKGAPIWPQLFSKLTRALVVLEPVKENLIFVCSRKYNEIAAEYLELDVAEVDMRVQAIAYQLKMFAKECQFSLHHICSWLARYAIHQSASSNWPDLIGENTIWHELVLAWEENKKLTNLAVYTPEFIVYQRVDLGLMTPEDFWVALSTMDLDPFDINALNYRMDQKSSEMIVRYRHNLPKRGVETLYGELCDTLDQHLNVDQALLNLINTRRESRNESTFDDLEAALEDGDVDHRGRFRKHQVRIRKNANAMDQYMHVQLRLATHAIEGAVYSVLDRSGRIKLAERAGMPSRFIQ